MVDQISVGAIFERLQQVPFPLKCFWNKVVTWRDAPQLLGLNQHPMAFAEERSTVVPCNLLKFYSHFRFKKCKGCNTNTLIYKYQPNLATDTDARLLMAAPTRCWHCTVLRAKDPVLPAWISFVQTHTVMQSHPVLSVASQCLVAILCWGQMF